MKEEICACPQELEHITRTSYWGMLCGEGDATLLLECPGCKALYLYNDWTGNEGKLEKCFSIRYFGPQSKEELIKIVQNSLGPVNRRTIGESSDYFAVLPWTDPRGI